jgi:hypothetical protein
MEYAMVDKITEIELDAIVSMVKARVRYSSRVSRIMRTITEALSFEEYCNSTAGKLRNPRMSRGAEQLMARYNASEFVKRTILEHHEPLKNLYASLCAVGSGLDRDKAKAILGEYPLVTVSKDEDRRLRELKPDRPRTPAQRYKDAGIEVNWNASPKFVSPKKVGQDIPPEKDDDPSQIAD